MSGFDVQMRSDAMIGQAKQQGLALEMQAAAGSRQAISQAGQQIQQQMQFSRQMDQRRQQFDAQLAQRADQFDRSLEQSQEQFNQQMGQRASQFEQTYEQNAAQFAAAQEVQQAELELREQEVKSKLRLNEHTIEQAAVSQKIEAMRAMLELGQYMTSNKLAKQQLRGATLANDQLEKSMQPEGKGSERIANMLNSRTALVNLAAGGRVIRDGMIVQDADAAKVLLDNLGYVGSAAKKASSSGSMGLSELLRLRESLMRQGDTGFDGFSLDRLRDHAGSVELLTRTDQLIRMTLGMSAEQAEQVDKPAVGRAVQQVVEQQISALRAADPTTTQPGETTAPPAQPVVDPVSPAQPAGGAQVEPPAEQLPRPPMTEPGGFGANPEAIQGFEPLSTAGQPPDRPVEPVGSPQTVQIQPEGSQQQIPYDVRMAGGYGLDALAQSPAGSDLLNQLGALGENGQQAVSRMGVMLGTAANQLAQMGVDPAFASQEIATSFVNGDNLPLTAEVMLGTGIPVENVKAWMMMRPALRDYTPEFRESMVDEAIEYVQKPFKPQPISSDRPLGAAASAQQAFNLATDIQGKAQDAVGVGAAVVQAGVDAAKQFAGKVKQSAKSVQKLAESMYEVIDGMPIDMAGTALNHAEDQLRQMGGQSSQQLMKAMRLVHGKLKEPGTTDEAAPFTKASEQLESMGGVAAERVLPTIERLRSKVRQRRDLSVERSEQLERDVQKAIRDLQTDMSYIRNMGPGVIKQMMMDRMNLTEQEVLKRMDWDGNDETSIASNRVEEYRNILRRHMTDELDRKIKQIEQTYLKTELKR